jgi:hypothetical protein
MKAQFAALLSLVAPAIASAAITVNVEGPDQVLLVGPSNLGNTNINRATVVPRELPSGRLKELLAPTIAAAIEQCKASDIASITLRASSVPDRIGGTSTRYGGLGIYVNLPSADRKSEGTWYVAPFFALEGEVSTSSGAREPIELFSVSRMAVTAGTDGTTQEDFFRAATPAIEASLSKYIAAALPRAVQKAVGSHCQAQSGQ